MTVYKPDQAQSLRDMIDNTPSRSMKLITVASGKGGVGKSSVAVNLAIALSQLGMRILIVDADFGLANVDVMLGVSPEHNLGNLIRGEKTLSQIIQESHNGIRFISGGSGVYELLRMDENQIQTILQSLMTLRDPADIILFDMGAGIHDNIVRMVVESSETIVITTPEPTAILDAYALIKTVLQIAPEHPMRLVMNKSDTLREAETVAEGFRRIVKQNLKVDIPLLGCVLYDAEMSYSIKRQTPLIIMQPNGPTARDIMVIARNLLDLPTPPKMNRLASLFAKLLG
ncbi:MAG: MinD/ParA family protein [Oscillospiraceae bacterium]|jgi:flagellar biosynthesis protein FlhG|nr:MinD/ParA family protein [Oscillospiraceae bacterium]